MFEFIPVINCTYTNQVIKNKMQSTCFHHHTERTYKYCGNKVSVTCATESTS